MGIQRWTAFHRSKTEIEKYLFLNHSLLESQSLEQAILAVWSVEVVSSLFTPIVHLNVPSSDRLLFISYISLLARIYFECLTTLPNEIFKRQSERPKYTPHKHRHSSLVQATASPVGMWVSLKWKFEFTAFPRLIRQNVHTTAIFRWTTTHFIECLEHISK